MVALTCIYFVPVKKSSENTMQTERNPSGSSSVTLPASHGGYGGTLFDPRWKARRRQILERDGYRCVNCGLDRDLEVHHRQYHFSRGMNVFKNPWEYDNRYLVTLCGTCHQKGHRLYKVPVKYVK